MFGENHAQVLEVDFPLKATNFFDEKIEKIDRGKVGSSKNKKKNNKSRTHPPSHQLPPKKKAKKWFPGGKNATGSRNMIVYHNADYYRHDNRGRSSSKGKGNAY